MNWCESASRWTSCNQLQLEEVYLSLLKRQDYLASSKMGRATLKLAQQELMTVCQPACTFTRQFIHAICTFNRWLVLLGVNLSILKDFYQI